MGAESSRLFSLLLESTGENFGRQVVLHYHWTRSFTKSEGSCSRGFAVVSAAHEDYNTKNEKHLDHAEGGCGPVVGVVQLVVDRDGQRTVLWRVKQNCRNELADSIHEG